MSAEVEPSYEQLAAIAAEQAQLIEAQAEQLRAQAERIAVLEQRLAADSSNSSRPPSSDAPWDKKPAPKHSSRARSGRRPGKQPGAGSVSRSLSPTPDRVVVLAPPRCRRCRARLEGAAACGRQRRQVIDAAPPPPPEVIEYQRVSVTCRCCGTVTTPGWDELSADDPRRGLVSRPGSPVRVGPETTARCALLTCGQFLPVARAAALLSRLAGIRVSTGFVAGVAGRAAAGLSQRFGPHLRRLLTTAPVLHADESPGRAAGGLAYVHVACTRYLTLMHVGGRSAADIDAGGVLPAYGGVLVRDGYAGYTHLTAAAHAWCGAHLLRDLASVAEADPHGQLWAQAMADTLLAAHRAAGQARSRAADRLDETTLATIRNHYLGALAKGRADNRARHGPLAAQAGRLIDRFSRFEDMILRFATDLRVPLTNNEAERAIRPVKLAQRASGGCWRTLQGLADFALVRSYLDTAAKWGIDQLDALRRLFTTGAWLPPALTPAE